MEHLEPVALSRRRLNLQAQVTPRHVALGPLRLGFGSRARLRYGTRSGRSLLPPDAHMTSRLLRMTTRDSLSPFTQQPKFWVKGMSPTPPKFNI